MKARLVNGLLLPILKSQFNGNVLQIFFSEIKCEEVAEIFSDKTNISTIKILDEEGNVISVLNGYVDEISVELINKEVIVNLEKEKDNFQEKLNELEKNNKLMQSQIDNTVAAVDFVLTEGI